MNINPFKSSLGLALGGGAARGLAHIGVLKALKENDIKVDLISGTSAGAIVASYYAFSKELKDLECLTELLRIQSVLSLSLSKMGLMSTDSLEKALHKDFKDVKIEDSPIPLAICTTDINLGKSLYLTKGSLVKALCASCAVPGIVQPVNISDHLLVDGGISNNVPVDILKQMGAAITVGINLNGVSKYPQVRNMADVIANSIDIAIDLQTKQKIEKADVDISLDLSEFSRFDNTKQKEEIIKRGYDHTIRKSKRIKSMIQFPFLFWITSLVQNLIPFKVPNFLKSLVKK